MAARKRLSRARRSKSEQGASGKESLVLDREALRYWRLQRGFTQQALAQQRAQLDRETVQLSYAQIRRIEADGRAGPGSARLLAALLGVELAQLRPRDARQLPCGLPREVSVDFVGRGAEIEAVLAALQREGKVRIAASVEGLPGIGKTELALQVCARLEQSRAFRIFWFNAEDPDLTAQWADIVARHLGIEHREQVERARLALRAIDTLGEPTLVVLDNAERWSASEPWPRPQGRHIRWLVTTRQSRLGERAFEHIELPVLDDASATELFTRIAGPALAQRSGFRELVVHLQGYTIAVELAAVFLGRFPEVEPAEYLKLLEQGKSDLVEDEVKHSTSYERTLESALDLLWQRLPARTRAAWELAACFAQDPASHELSDACGLGRRVRAELRDYHLIQSDFRSWTMHRLVREFALRRALPSGLLDARAALVRGSAEHLDREGVWRAQRYIQDRSHLDSALRLASELFPEGGERLAALRRCIGEVRQRAGLLPDPRPLLHAAAAFYRNQVASSDPQRDPRCYAQAQLRLASTLYSFDLQNFDAELVKAAVHASREAIRALEPERNAWDWARAHSLLAGSLLGGANFKPSIPDLDEAVAAYRTALGVYVHGPDRSVWGSTQRQLGVVLMRRWQLDPSSGSLAPALDAFSAALEVLPREDNPLQWAQTQDVLSQALCHMAEPTADPDLAVRAVAAARAALEVRTRQYLPGLWRTSASQLARSLSVLALCREDVSALRESAELFRSVLQETDCELHPDRWARSAFSLTSALREIARRAPALDELAEAVDLARRGLTIHTRERDMWAWVAWQSQLGNLLAHYGERRGDPAQVEEAIAHCRLALSAHARETHALIWGDLQSNLGEALAALGRCTAQAEPQAEAVVCLRLAQDVFTRDEYPRIWRALEREIARVQAAVGVEASTP